MCEISIVTPSYNQAQFLDRTIQSVLQQGPVDIQYLVVDGGSTDGSINIIEKYSSQLAWWVSERDSGQSAAINKGFERATGSLMCWLNSDDWLLPDSVSFVVSFFKENPTVDMVCGNVWVTSITGEKLFPLKARYAGLSQLVQFWRGYHMHQPSIFWRRRVYDEIGGLDESLHLSMDFDFWVRAARKFNIVAVDQFLSCATSHPDQKTADGNASYKVEQWKNVWDWYKSPLHVSEWNTRMAVYIEQAKRCLRNRSSLRYIKNGFSEKRGSAA